jgi:hypothetical protein
LASLICSFFSSVVSHSASVCLFVRLCLSSSLLCFFSLAFAAEDDDDLIVQWNPKEAEPEWKRIMRNDIEEKRQEKLDQVIKTGLSLCLHVLVLFFFLHVDLLCSVLSLFLSLLSRPSRLEYFYRSVIFCPFFSAVFLTLVFLVLCWLLSWSHHHFISVFLFFR